MPSPSKDHVYDIITLQHHYIRPKLVPQRTTRTKTAAVIQTLLSIDSSTYAPDSSVTLGGNPRADSTKQHPGRACTGRRRA